MRIINFLAASYSGLLAVTKTLQYFNSKPETSFERLSREVNKAFNDDVNTIENAIFLISIISVVLLVFWIVALVKNSRSFQRILLAITFILAFFTYLIDNNLIF